MSSLLSMSKFLGGRGRERRRQNSTGSLVSVNSLGSTDNITSRGSPKTPPSKLSNIFSSNLVSSSLSTLKAGRTRADSIVESSSDTNSVLASSYIRVPIADNLAPDVSPGSAKPPGAEETLYHPKAQDAELARDRAHEHAQDIEEEHDRVLVRARDARDLQDKAQKRIQELEDTLKAVEAALSSKVKTIDTLTTSSEGLQSQIRSLEVDLQKAVSVSKNANEERDRAFEYAREANETQVSMKDALNEAQSRVQELENTLKSVETTSEERQSQIVVAQERIQVLEHELTLKSRTVDTLTTDTERMQSRIDDLTTDLCTSVAVSKNIEEDLERARLRAREVEDAQVAKAARIRELENHIESSRIEMKSKLETIVALTTTSEALESRIGALERDIFVRGQELEHERTLAQVRVREAEEQRDSAQKQALELEEQRATAQLAAKDAHAKAQERIQALQDELSSKSQALDALSTTSNGLESQIKALTTDLRDTLTARKDMEDERDGALVRMRDLADAHEKAQAQNQALEDALQYAKAEIGENSKTIDDLSATSAGLRLRIDTLESDLSKALSTSKLREDERDAALIQVRRANEATAAGEVYIQKLEDALRSTKDELCSKSHVLEALTASSEAQHMEIDTLKSNLRNALDWARDNALARVRDSEEADRKAQAHIEALQNTLQSTQAKLNAKAQEVDTLTSGSKGLRAENDSLKSALRDALAVAEQLEEECNAASSQVRDARKAQEAAQVYIKQLENDLRNVKAKLASKCQAFDALKRQGSEADSEASSKQLILTSIVSSALTVLAVKGLSRR